MIDQTKPRVKALTESQLKEMQSINIIMTLWVRWKKTVKSPIALDLEDVEDVKDLAA